MKIDDECRYSYNVGEKIFITLTRDGRRKSVDLLIKKPPNSIEDQWWKTKRSDLVKKICWPMLKRKNRKDNKKSKNKTTR